MKDFARRYPWTVAFVVLFIAMLIGFFRTEQIADDRAADVAERRAATLIRDKQFCRAIPGVAVSSAQALVNVVLLDGTRRGWRVNDLNRARLLGREFTAEAQRLALANLPECEKILKLP